jgi:hypothetical protein
MLVLLPLAQCTRCKSEEARGKHPWCSKCRALHDSFRKRLRATQLSARGYRSGWEACAARVREGVERGLSAMEIAARL